MTNDGRNTLRFCLAALMPVAITLIAALALTYHAIGERRTNEKLAIIDICQAYFYEGGSDETCPKRMAEFLQDEEVSE